MTIDRHVTVSDVGKAINPLQVRMQDEGAAIMGLGHTLMEQYLFDDEGRIRNLGAIDYRIPTRWTCRRRSRARAIENGDGPGPVRREGDERGRAAVRRAGGRGRGPRRDGRADPGAAALARSGSGTRCRRGRARCPHDLGLRVRRPASTWRRRSCVLLLGGKAANLATMAVELGLPVPPAFTITTEACRAYLASGWPDGLDEELRAAGRAARGAGRAAVRGPGGPAARVRPVRRAAVDARDDGHDPQPRAQRRDRGGAGARRPATPAFARDCHERFRATVPRRSWASRRPRTRGQQLRGAIEAVFRSWTSDRAATYRRVEGIPDDLGTGVTVQAMVFGNRGADSGTGVLFTRNPATGEDEPYGDVLFDAQGEDVVAGTHATEPIAVLGARLPAVAAELRRARRDASSATTATAATSSSRSSAAGCGCSRCGSASGRRRPRCGWRSRWPRTRRSR